jgi:hypothetical protein
MIFWAVVGVAGVREGRFQTGRLQRLANSQSLQPPFIYQ